MKTIEENISNKHLVEEKTFKLLRSYYRNVLLL